MENIFVRINEAATSAVLSFSYFLYETAYCGFSHVLGLLELSF